MNVRVKILLAIGSIGFILPVHGVFYSACALQSPDGRKRVVLLADNHRPCEDSKVAARQRNELLTYAQWKKALVIAEDSSDFDVNNMTSQLLDGKNRNDHSELEADIALYKNDYEASKNVTPLCGLIEQCNTKKIACKNIEFRFFRLLWIYGVEHKRQLLSYVTNDMLLQESEEIKQEITQYATLATGRLYTGYKNILDNYEKSKKSMGAIMQSPPLTPYSLNSFKMFDDVLIDARILHTIDCSSEPTIIVCAGGRHIDNVITELKHLGFTEIDSVHAQEKTIEKIVNNQSVSHLTASSAVDTADFFKDIDTSWSMLHWFKKIAVGAIVCTCSYFMYKLFRK